MPLSLGKVLSLEACDRLVLGLQERAEAFKTARLEVPAAHCVGDGLWRKVAVPTGAYSAEARGRRRAVKHKQTRVMLTALGLWGDGHWEMLSWHLADTEDAAS